MSLPKNEWHWGCESCGTWCQDEHYPVNPTEEDHIFCPACWKKIQQQLEKNPFVKHAKLLLTGQYSTADKLRLLAMSLWNGHDYPFNASYFGGMDNEHFGIAMAMIQHYRMNGEGCQAFMDLCEKLRKIVPHKDAN